MLPGNSVMTSLFMEDGLTTQGQSMPSKREKSERSRQVDSAMKTIDSLSKKDGADKVITTILSNSVPSLRMYVMGQRETPETDINSLSMQVALLRMADTATVARDMNISDYDATCLIEGIENDLIKKGHFNSKYILPYDTQAAVNAVIDTITEKHKTSGGTGKLADIIDELKASSVGSYFDFNDSVDKMMDGPVYYNDHPDMGWYTPINTDAIDPGPAIGTTPITTSTGSTSGVLDFINKAIEVVKDATGSVQTLGSTTGNVLDNIKNAAGDIGGDIAAQSLKEAIIKNLPLIIGVVVAIVLIILFITHVAKPKR